MKIYKSVTISMSTGEVLQEDSYEYVGLLAECKGGSSGEVKFPAYQESQHTTWLNLMDTIVDAEIAGNSPYFSAAAYDPAAIISDDDAAISAHAALITALDSPGDWEAAVDTVITKLRDSLPDSDAIDSAVNTFDIRTAPAHFRGLGRLAASYGDINAANGSAFFVAMAIAETNKVQQLESYATELSLRHESVKLQLIAMGIQLILGNKNAKVQLSQGATELLTTTNARHVVMNVDEANTNMEWSTKDARWDLETLLYAGNLLGAVQGGTMVPDRPSAGQSALSGALSGASMGGKFGPLGAVAGGVAGALFGLFS